jgi:hypothetical protein
VDIDERTRLAATWLPKPGLLAGALGRNLARTRTAFAIGVAVATLAAMQVGVPLPVILAVTASAVAFLAVVYRAALKLTDHLRRGNALLADGFLEEAGEGFSLALEQPLALPAARAVVALELAVAATLAGHAERAVVLLRAVETSGALPREHDGALGQRMAIALLALGHADKAALAGDPVVAVDLGEALASRTRTAGSHPGRPLLRWLMVAYAWRRRGDADKAASAALRARGVPAHLHLYLAQAWPAFGTFAASIES